MISLYRVSGVIAKKPVLSGVSLDVLPGEWICLHNKNFSERSLLLKILAGIILPDQGKIMFDGIDISTVPKKYLSQVRQKICFIPQKDIFNTCQTVYEAVSLPLKLLKPLPDEVKNKTRWLLKRLTLANNSNTPVNNLSTDERKLTAVARGLILQPMIICLEEPWAGLKPEYIKTLNELLNFIHQQGATIICTADSSLVLNNLPLRQIELSEGQVVADRKAKTEELIGHEEKIISETIKRAISSAASAKQKRSPLHKNAGKVRIASLHSL